MGLLLTSVNLFSQAWFTVGFNVINPQDFRVVWTLVHKLDDCGVVIVVTDTLVPYLAINDNIQDKHGINKLLSMEGPEGGDVTVCFLFPFWEMCNWI